MTVDVDITVGIYVEMLPPWVEGQFGPIVDIRGAPEPEDAWYHDGVRWYTVDLPPSRGVGRVTWTGPYLDDCDEPYFRVLTDEEAALLILAHPRPLRGRG